MKREIIKKMIKIAGPKRAGDLSYDLKALEGYDGKFLWIIYGESYTRLVKCSKEFILKMLNESQANKYYFARNGWKLDVPDWGSPKYFWCGGGISNMLTQINLEQADQWTEAEYDEAIAEWVKMGNSLPTQLTVGSIRFLCDEKYVKEQLKFAEKHNDNSLKDIFRRLRNRPRCSDSHEITVSKDFEERSFLFTETVDNKPIMNGGIIYHGYKNEGYKENHSVQLVPTYGWSIHT